MVELIKLLINLFFIIFFFSIWIIIILRINLLLILIAIELGLYALSFLLLLYGFIYDQLVVQMYVLTLLVVSACEAAIGLGLFIQYYRLNGTLDLDYLNYIKA